MTVDRSPVKPGPHIDLRGRPHEPIGTLAEQWQRVHTPRRQPYQLELRQRFLLTLETDPSFARDIAQRLGVR